MEPTEPRKPKNKGCQYTNLHSFDEGPTVQKYTEKVRPQWFHLKRISVEFYINNTTKVSLLYYLF